MMKRGKTIGWALLGLYLVTWLPAVFIIRHDRKVYRPRVYPVLPFVVLACDKKPSLAGEWSFYAAYGVGVSKLFEIHTWIA